MSWLHIKKISGINQQNIRYIDEIILLHFLSQRTIAQYILNIMIIYFMILSEGMTICNVFLRESRMREI
jgi:hypothetical protein